MSAPEAIPSDALDAQGFARETARLGMTLFLCSWAMLFAGLFFVVAAARSRVPEWPPAGTWVVPRRWPALGMLALLLSSGALVWWTRQERRRAVPAALTLACGALFFGLQALLWTGASRAGLSPQSGSYGAVFWTLTVFHALHAALGLAALTVLAAWGATPERSTPALKLWAMYWHFVALVCALIFFAVFF